MKLRGTSTNNLIDIIQMLQLAHKTGKLILQREGKGDTVEQGAMMLQNGQIIDANLGLIKGKDAFDKLSTWNACYFVFQSSPDTPNPGPTPQATTLPGRTAIPTVRRNGATPFDGLVERKETFDELSLTSTVPYRLRDFQDVLGYFDRLGLTRAHRQLFLLINGRYSLAELMRLAGHHSDDFERLFADLERVGLIHR